MASIKRQSVYGIGYALSGVFLGFIISGIALPNLLEKEEIGFLNLVVRISTAAAFVSSLGFLSPRFFPYFEKEKNENGFLLFSLTISLIGFLVVSSLYTFTYGYFLDDQTVPKDVPFNYLIVLPLTFSFSLFYMLDYYGRCKKRSQLGISLRDFYQRLAILLISLLFFLNIISKSFFIFNYFFILFLMTPVLWLTLSYKSGLRLKPFSLKKIKPSLKKEMFSVSLFSLISGVSNYLVTTVDLIFVNLFIGLQATGVYSVGAFFGSFILVPGRVINISSNQFISESFANNNHVKVLQVYRKSCVYQGIIGGAFFGLILINLPIAFLIIPEYTSAAPVIFWLGLAAVADLVSGINTTIISFSKLYKYNALLVVSFGICVIIFNYSFIPIYGMTGGAFATFLSMVIYNFAKYWILFKKFNFSPISLRLVSVVSIILISGISLSKINMEGNLFLIQSLKTFAFTLINAIVIFKSKLIDWSDLLPSKKPTPLQ